MMRAAMSVAVSVTTVGNSGVIFVWFVDNFLLVVFLSGHHLSVCLEWCHTLFFFAVGDQRVWNVWNLARWFVGTTLWFAFNPDTTLTFELPLVTPFGRNKLTVTLACELTNVETIFFPTFILGIWLIWFLTSQFPFTSAPAVPVSSLGVTLHRTWWRRCIHINLFFVNDTNNLNVMMGDHWGNSFMMMVNVSFSMRMSCLFHNSGG